MLLHALTKSQLIELQLAKTLKDPYQHASESTKKRRLDYIRSDGFCAWTRHQQISRIILIRSGTGLAMVESWKHPMNKHMVVSTQVSGHLHTILSISSLKVGIFVLAASARERRIVEPQILHLLTLQFSASSLFDTCISHHRIFLEPTITWKCSEQVCRNFLLHSTLGFIRGSFLTSPISSVTVQFVGFNCSLRLSFF